MNLLKRLRHLSLLLGLVCFCFLCSCFLSSCSSHRIRNKVAISAAVDDARLMKQSSNITVRCVRQTDADMAELLRSGKKFTTEEAKELSIFWNVDVSGLKPNCNYYFYLVNTLKQICLEEQLIIGSNDEIFLKNYGIPLKRLIPSFSGFVDGEDAAFVVVSDEEVPEYGAGLICLKPIFCSWKDGGLARVCLSDLGMKYYSLVGRGFLPQESFVIVQNYGSVLRRNEIQADGQGKFMFLLSTHNEPLSGGTAAVTIERAEGRGEGVLKFLWGSEATATKNMYSDF